MTKRKYRTDIVTRYLTSYKYILIIQYICGSIIKSIQCLSPAKKYKLYKSSINKSIHFAQRRLSSSTRG